MNMQDAARIALACLDLTSLNDADTAADIELLCRKAQSPHGMAAAVCVWPRFVGEARAALPAAVRVAAVANFPDGSLDTDRAVRETTQILAAGGDEVDLVLPYRAFATNAAGDHAACAALVAAVRRACEGKTLKLILETGELRDPQLIRAASQLGLDEGADFLKTSTGKSQVSATLEAAGEMLREIAVHPRGANVGFKAAGGIRKVADAVGYIEITRTFLGEASVTPKRLRFGASGLLADIEAVLSGTVNDTPASTAY
ncbi:MAG: deoxyribose-phosphate aldolase [Burkholderiaceae bacterium]